MSQNMVIKNETGETQKSAYKHMSTRETRTTKSSMSYPEQNRIFTGPELDRSEKHADSSRI